MRQLLGKIWRRFWLSYKVGLGGGEPVRARRFRVLRIAETWTRCLGGLCSWACAWGTTIVIPSTPFANMVKTVL